MLYRVTNHTTDGVNVVLRGVLSHVQPGESVEVDLGQVEAVSLPESVFDVEAVVEPQPAPVVQPVESVAEPPIIAEPSVPADTQGAVIAEPSVPADTPVSNIGS